MASKAVQRRFDAVGALVQKFLTRENGYQTQGTAEQRAEYARMAREMTALGRTQRWQANCEGAARSAEDMQADFGWTVRQWSVYLGYAAE